MLLDGRSRSALKITSDAVASVMAALPEAGPVRIRWWPTGRYDHERAALRALGCCARALPVAARDGRPVLERIDWWRVGRVLVHPASPSGHGTARRDSVETLWPVESMRLAGALRGAGTVRIREADWPAAAIASAVAMSIRARDLHAAAGVGNWMGACGPGGVLLVGDQRSGTVQRRWRRRGWPWFSSIGSSRLLLRALWRLMGPWGAWSACNARLDDGSPVDMRSVVSTLRPLGVVALGEMAALACSGVGVQVRKMEHPEWWCRFRASETAAFRQRLGLELQALGVSVSMQEAKTKRTEIVRTEIGSSINQSPCEQGGV